MKVFYQNIRKLKWGVLLFMVLGYQAVLGMEVSGLDKALTEEDFLTVHGSIVKNQKGEEVILRGTNIGGWLVQESWMTATNSPYQKETIRVFTERFTEEGKDELIKIYEDHYFTEKDLDFLQTFGMNVLRLPFSYMNLQHEDGSFKENGWERLDWFIEEAGKRGMYVILDLHGAMGSQNGNDHSGDASDGARLFVTEEYIQATVDLWGEIASRYQGNPTIAAYDILNEPGGEQNRTTSLEWDVFDRIYQRIREVDKEHIIMIESCWDPKDLPHPSKYGWENVIYQYHNYLWNADNDFSKQRTYVDQRINGISIANYQVPVHIGEFTAFVNLDSWKYTLAKYNEAGYHWTTWTYKVTGDSSWGIINQNIPKVDIYNDSKEEIIEKWSRVGEGEVNPRYHDVIKAYIDGSTNLPERVKPSIEVASTWYQDLQGEVPITAGIDASVSLLELDGDNVIKLTTTKNQDPGMNLQNVKVPSQFGKTQDASGYLYLNFSIKDTHGDNSYRVTLADGKGSVNSVWTSGNGKKDQWVTLQVSLESFSNLDIGSIKEVRIGAWNAGTYYIKDIYFSQQIEDNKPDNQEQNNKELMIPVEEPQIVEEQESNLSLYRPWIGLGIGTVMLIVILLIIKKRRT